MVAAQVIDAFVKVGVFVFLVEAVTQLLTVPISKRWSKSPAWVDQSIAILIAVGSCIVFKVDVFAMVGFTGVHPLIGQTFTGALVSRGSNYWHDVTLRAAPKQGGTP